MRHPKFETLMSYNFKLIKFFNYYMLTIWKLMYVCLKIKKIEIKIFSTNEINKNEKFG